MLTLQGFTFNAFSENTYLLTNENKECWVIDPGMNSPEEKDWFLAYLRENELKPQGIINTHTHIDHIFGVNALTEAFGIAFRFHEKDQPVLDAAKGSAIMFGFEFDTAPKPDGYIKEGETLRLGTDELEVRFTPGHSPGSISFYYPAGKFVISGDALFEGSIGRTDLPGGNFDVLIDAIKTQLLTLPEDTVVYSGHGQPTTIGQEKQHNQYLR